MNSTRSFIQYGACVSAAAACAAVMAMRAPGQELADGRNETPAAAYLDCAHLLRAVRDPDLITLCIVVAGAHPRQDAGDPLASQPRPAALFLARAKTGTYAAPAT